jgi:hypothetical protein
MFALQAKLAWPKRFVLDVVCQKWFVAQGLA